MRVRNADDETLRNVAVTVETQAKGANAPIAFGQRSSGPDLADSGRARSGCSTRGRRAATRRT